MCIITQLLIIILSGLPLSLVTIVELVFWGYSINIHAGPATLTLRQECVSAGLLLNCLPSCQESSVDNIIKPHHNVVVNAVIDMPAHTLIQC